MVGTNNNLIVSSRALLDLKRIKHYSVKQWGKHTALKYLSDLQRGLDEITAYPSLMRTPEDIPKNLKLYRVREHFLVCMFLKNNIYLLTVQHASMDLPNRLRDLMPNLISEVAFLHQKLKLKVKSK